MRSGSGMREASKDCVMIKGRCAVAEFKGKVEGQCLGYY